MATLNDAIHLNDSVVLHAGEILLLFCESVHLELKGHGTIKGRMYLTSHRVVFTAKDRSTIRSFSCPFYVMFDLGLEQPIFGANYIRGKAKGPNNSVVYSFELKFKKGGAIEFGEAMSKAARQAAALGAQFQPPPPYTPSAADYYQDTSNPYQPDFPIGFVLPTHIFQDVPQQGLVYRTPAPPPYPGFIDTGFVSNPSQPAYPAYPAYPQQSTADVPPSYNATGYTPYPPYNNQPQQQQPPAYEDKKAN